MHYNVLFLDDSPARRKSVLSVLPTVCVVETARETIDLLKQRRWNIVSLDHDLGGRVFDDPHREDCGMEVVRYLYGNRQPIDAIIIHSFNTSASETMEFYLRQANYTAIRRPFDIQAYKDIQRQLER